MGDIYSINNWATATLYEANAIVLVGNLYYYATARHTSGTFAIDLNAGKWNGILNYSGEQKPFFFWKLSYGYSLPIKPVVKNIQFGDGYSQTFSDGINNILLNFDVSFSDRSLAEYTAILHFLTTRAGAEKFFFVPPAPFNIIKQFVCLEWNPTQTFYDKYSIGAKFEERI
jgi:phage-related protein